MRSQLSRFTSIALSCALGALLCATTYGQDSAKYMRLAQVKVRVGQTADFDAMNHLLIDAYKKAGVPWRQVWSVSLFGEGGMNYIVTPVQDFAQFDADGPMTKLSAEDRVTYTNLARNAVESAEYKLIMVRPELSLLSERAALPKYARVTTIKAKAGKAPEVEALIAEMLVPALKAAGVKDYWVHSTVVGGPLGEYVTVQIFDKWSELDAVATSKQIFGENYGKYMARVATCIEGARNETIKLEPKLTYMPEK